MRDLLRADLYRLFRARWFWLCAGFMVALALALIAVQRTAMDYTVALSRVLFLPMSFYGVAVAALVGLFIGDDYHDGMMRNKVAAGRPRREIYMSAQIACWLGCLAIYTLTVLTTACVGARLFAANVTSGMVFSYYLLGVCTSIAYASIFCMASMLCRSRSVAVVLCMASAFVMLFLCLHTHQALIQEAFADGAPNPAYVGGVKRTMYLFLHDMNPCGQAAQLSVMHCYNAFRFIAADLFYAGLSASVGASVFCKADIA